MNKSIKRIAPAMLVLIGLATLSFTAKDGITLKLQPQKGKTYTITTKNTSMNLMEVMGRTQNQSQNMETRQSFTVKETSAEQSVLETKIEALKMNIGAGGMKLEYDSEHPEKTSPMLASQTAEMEKSLNKPVNITYDAQGKLVGEADLEMNQLSAAIISLPKDEVSVGSKWSDEKTQNLSGTEFTVNYEFTVTAISKKSVDISYTGNVNSKDVSGKIEGTGRINPQTGILMKRNEKQNLSMTITQQGLSIPVTMAATTTVTVEEK